MKPVAALPILVVVALAGCGPTSTTDAPDDGPVTTDSGGLDRSATLWAPYVEWTLVNRSYEGNPFDLAATAVFTHRESGERRETEMFYAGEDRWRFRFTGTRTGRWTFVTSSADSDLDGRCGEVDVAPNPDPEVRGFLATRGPRIVRTNGDGSVSAFPWKIFADGNLEVHRAFGYSEEDPVTRFGDRAFVEAYVRKALHHGSNWIFFSPRNEFLRSGAVAHTGHDSENPDLASFRAIEAAIVVAHRMGAGVHLWAWGDEQRRWTPVGLPGGINGHVDRRLQRYIAARLGPLPGWTMSYGFDLNEWVSPEQANAWARHLKDRMGWDHLLMARGPAYDGPDLDVQSIGGPGPSSYAETLAREGGAKPLLEEERFLHGRVFGGVLYDMDRTMDLWWWMAMAGGTSGFWGTSFACEGARPCPEYPRPEWMRIHEAFWRDRYRLDLEPVAELGDGASLAGPIRERFVFYEEDASSLRMDLSSAASGALRAVAVDTRGDRYTEIDIGPLTPELHTWKAPHASDWVVAVGEF